MELSEAIKRVRWELRLSQVELAKELACSQMSISSWELNYRSPSYKILKRLDAFIKKHNLDIKLI